MSHSSQPHRLQPIRLLCPWDYPGKNIGMGCYFLLQGIFLTWGWNLHLLCLLPGRWFLYLLSLPFIPIISQRAGLHKALFLHSWCLLLLIIYVQRPLSLDADNCMCNCINMRHQQTGTCVFMGLLNPFRYLQGFTLSPGELSRTRVEQDFVCISFSI